MRSLVWYAVAIVLDSDHCRLTLAENEILTIYRSAAGSHFILDAVDSELFNGEPQA